MVFIHLCPALLKIIGQPVHPGLEALDYYFE